MIDATPLTHPDVPGVSTCLQCGAALAGDQRWCLQCGTRRAGLPSPFDTVPAPPAAPVLERTTTTYADAPEPRRPGWAGPAAAAGLATGALVIGLLLGGNKAAPTTQVSVPPAKAPVVNVSVPAGGAVAGAVAVSSDWPAGEDGWTVRLESLAAEGATQASVDAAKTAATGKGAPDVGALVSDDYASLASGQLLVYSGVFKTKAKATAALRKLRGDFPGAKVVRVSAAGDDEPAATLSDDDLKQGEDLSPDEFQKRSKKLPDKVQTDGAPPPKDDKPAGGGSEGTTIG